MTTIYNAPRRAVAISELGLSYCDMVQSHTNVAAQWVHVLALMGDTSDNVPGVPGVGAKGALSLIQEYGTVESVLENADKVRRGCRVLFMPDSIHPLVCCRYPLHQCSLA